MYSTIKLRDEVWTVDGHRLGVAAAFHYRPEDEVDLGARLYPVYLEVKNYELGEDFFIPLVFVAERDSETGHLLLSQTMKQVLDNTWGRMPDFVAKMEGRVEPLPKTVEEVAEHTE